MVHSHQDTINDDAFGAAAAQFNPAHLKAANIIPATGLATDYLNVFNEAIMLLDLVHDMPELFEELQNWKFLDYAEHFKRSNFEARDLAIEVYNSLPFESRIDIDTAAYELGEKIDGAIKTVGEAIENEQPFNDFLEEVCPQIRDDIMAIDAIIHGKKQNNSEQDAIDALFD